MSAQFDEVSIWLHAFIPMAVVDAVGNCFSGDDRDFSDDPSEQRFRARGDRHLGLSFPRSANHRVPRVR